MMRAKRRRAERLVRKVGEPEPPKWTPAEIELFELFRAELGAEGIDLVFEAGDARGSEQ